jgi:protein-S-isoprenylcysteine O-methyltransferase Ste14
MSDAIVLEPANAADTRLWIRKSIISLLLLVIVLFWSAGRLDWWQAWAYFVLVTAFTATSYIALQRYAPGLLAERSKLQAGTKTWDKWLASTVAIGGSLALWITAGLDVRFGWTGERPLWEAVAGLAGSAAGAGLVLRAMAENRFFASTVRIQTERGHKVIDSGPYSLVRHPGYVGWGVSMLSAPFALGSMTALIPVGICLLLLLVRTALEDRTLQRELPGYADYARSVRSRLIPGIW